MATRQGRLLIPIDDVTITGEAMVAAPIVCAVCEKTEEYCDCEKYCTICKGQFGIRLCVDGLYYCPDCREACEMRLANELRP